MSIDNLMIIGVEEKYSHAYIAQAFWNKDIAELERVTLIPYLQYNKTFYIAYIKVRKWCDSEVAFSFVHRLNLSNKPVSFIHNTSKDWWPVQLNTHNDGNICLSGYTYLFNVKYLETNEDENSDPYLHITRIQDNSELDEARE